MERDAKKMRGDRPFIFTNMKTGEGLDQVVRWIKHEVLLIEPEGD
jgi:urease accessory protein